MAKARTISSWVSSGRNTPRFGCHAIFHLFILLGSVAHFVMMYTVIAFL